MCCKIKKERNPFIHQTCIKLIKSDSEDIYNVTKVFFFLNALINLINAVNLKFHQGILKNVLLFPQKMLSSTTFFIIDNIITYIILLLLLWNVTKSAYFRMIFEGSRNTEK